MLGPEVTRITDIQYGNFFFNHWFHLIIPALKKPEAVAIEATVAKPSLVW